MTFKAPKIDAQPAGAIAGVPAAPVKSGRPSAWRRLTSNSVASFGLALLGIIILIAFSAPILPLADPNTTDVVHRLAPPLTAGHLLGTDQVGRDILSRLIWGTRVSFAVGVAAAVMAALIGSAIGLFAAFYGKIVDMLLMRGIDMLMAFPYLLLALAIVAALGPGLLNAMVAIIIVNIPFFARAVRGATLAVVRADFMAAARLSGVMAAVSAKWRCTGCESFASWAVGTGSRSASGCWTRAICSAD